MLGYGFDKRMTEDNINKFVADIVKEVDAKIVSSNGTITPYEVKLPDIQNYCSCPIRFGKIATNKVTGEGIINGKNIISKLPLGITGTLMPNLNSTSSRNVSASGHVTILIEVSQDYALERHKQFMHKSKDFINRIKERHSDIIMKLAEHAKNLLYAEYKNATIYENGLFENEGDCQGSGISFAKLGMANLSTTQERYSLAVAITDILNTELEQEGNKYYIEQSYDKFSKRDYVVIKVKITETKPNLTSW